MLFLNVGNLVLVRTEGNRLIPLFTEEDGESTHSAADIQDREESVRGSECLAEKFCVLELGFFDVTKAQCFRRGLWIFEIPIVQESALENSAIKLQLRIPSHSIQRAGFSEFLEFEGVQKFLRVERISDRRADCSF